jgi:hypothetical protein
MSEIALTWAKVAGIGGIALFVFLVIFRDVIKKKIFPRLSPDQAFKIILLILVLTFLIACVGISAWYLISEHDIKAKSEQQFWAVFLGAIISNANAAPPDNEAARNERLNRFRLLEQILQNGPDTYKTFEDAKRRVQELLVSKVSGFSDEVWRETRNKLELGQVAPTVEMLLKVAGQRDSDAAEAHYLAGILLESRADFNAALKEYIAASRASNTEDDYFSKAVGLALNVGKFSVAESLVNSRLALQEGGLLTSEREGLYLGLSGLAKWYQGRLSDAEAEFERALKVLAGKPSIALAQVLNNSSPIYKTRGLLGVSEGRLRRSAEIYACLVGERDFRYLNVLLNLAAVFILQGSYGNAGAVLDKVVSTLDRTGVEQPPEKFLSAQALVVRGNMLRAQEQLDESEKSLLKALSLMDSIHANLTFSYARAETYLGATYLDKKSLDRATKRLESSLGSNLRLFGDDHFETGNSYMLLAATWSQRGDLQRSRTYLRQAKAAMNDKLSSSPQFARIHEVEGEIEQREGRIAEAEKLIKNACQIYASVPALDPSRLSNCYASLSDVLQQEGRQADASATKALAFSAKAKIRTSPDANAVPSKANC